MGFDERLKVARDQKSQEDQRYAQAIELHKRRIHEAQEAAQPALRELREAIVVLRRNRSASEDLLGAGVACSFGVKAEWQRNPPQGARAWFQRSSSPATRVFAGWRVARPTSGSERIVELFIPLDGDSSVKFSSEVRIRQRVFGLDAFAQQGIFEYQGQAGEDSWTSQELSAADGLNAFIFCLAEHLAELPSIAP